MKYCICIFPKTKRFWLSLYVVYRGIRLQEKTKVKFYFFESIGMLAAMNSREIRRYSKQQNSIVMI